MLMLGFDSNNPNVHNDITIKEFPDDQRSYACLYINGLLGSLCLCHS